MKTRHALRLAIPIAAVIGALAIQTLAFAATDTPPASAKQTAGPSSISSGQSATYTFQFFDSTGSPDAGLSVTFTDPHVSGCGISPTSGTTNSNGAASTVLTCAANSGRGIETITASACQPTTSNCASSTVNVTVNGGSTSGAPLPFTGTDPPGPNPWLIAAIVLAVVVLAGGGTVLVRGRQTA